MKSTCGAAIVSLLLWMSLIRNGQAESNPPVSILTARGDDTKTPLIVLTSPITKPVISEEVRDETTEAETGTTIPQEAEVTDAPVRPTKLPQEADVTEVPVRPTKPTRAPQKKKPGPNLWNGPQGYLQAQLLSMPEMWNSSPQSALGSNVMPSMQPWFYPMPVYIPYPIPFMLNYAQSWRKGNSEDQMASKFNEQLAENLLRDSGLSLNNIWKDQNLKKIANRNLPKRWRGKFKKTTTTTTTTEAPTVTVPTVPTRILKN